MCRSVRCQLCGKTTWAGRGQHVDHVLGSVAPADRCPGHPEQRSAEGRSVFTRLFGRR